MLPKAAVLHPMQRAVLDCPLPDGPMLSIIEDATGAGKTEAALMLAARMMQAGKARGCFFALPTMATANAMLPRLEAAADVFFDTAPSLTLSHGRADLSARFRDIRGRPVSNPENGPHCGPWLSDGRRKSLLADLGVGTIDQVLLGVLPTRFNGLRLWAVADRVLIVDEAHSYDPYMQAQLERLLKMQARLGGSAIVLTATLPGPKKRAFETAFQSGVQRKPRRARRRAPAQIQRELAPYPALSTIATERAVTAVSPAPGTVRSVAVDRIGSVEDAVATIAGAACKGAACIWVRNAVDDAIAAVELLQHAGVEADLLHARFAMCDRLHHEDRLQDRFGKTGQGRAGKVLVATQVAEQSLDLDFDVMVSDVAPIGSLIQRAGRLWRHMAIRPAATRPVPGPRLTVLSPDPDSDVSDRWLHTVLDRGAYVYDPTVVWRSARAVFDAGQIEAPGGVRALIEAVEGDAP
ncbi:MAG: CRISPR-associated helicase Cas3', partial [Marinibacterium sp.]|nr:CRISPR-associated helicase Cas3' [Marinibacterium sp.]